MKNEYSETLELQDFIKNNSVNFTLLNDNKIDISLISIQLSFGSYDFNIQIFDEYKDFKFNNNLLNIILALRDLQLIEDSKDYLAWCNQIDLKPNSDLLNYYIKSIKNIQKIQSYFPGNKITSFIADMDFQLNSGAIQSLRK